MSVMLLAAGPARGELCPAMAGADPALASLDAQARFSFVRAAISAAASHARKWRYGWTGGYGAIVAGQLALTPLRDSGARIDGYFGAGASAVGIGAVLFQSLPAIGDDQRLPGGAGGSTNVAVDCALLRRAEAALAHQAEGEHRGRHVLNHLAGFAFNIAVAAVMTIRFARYTMGGIQLGLGMAAGEAMIATLPNEATRALDSYRAGRLVAPAAPAIGVQLFPSAGRDHAGLSLGLTF